MTNDRPRRTATHSARRPPAAARRPTHRPSPQLVSAAVVAEYIHEISRAHRPTPRPGAARRPATDPGCA